jgi:hypothetical protein
MVTRRIGFRPFVHPLYCTLLLALMGSMSGTSARAAAPASTDTDVTALSQLEDRANLADPREKCFLYAQVLAGLTELEGRQIASGEDEQARATMQRMDDVAAKVHEASAANAKRLKNAEQMLERTTHRVSDMVRVVSSQQRAALQSTLQHMNAVHNDVLAMVFAH